MSLLWIQSAVINYICHFITQSTKIALFLYKLCVNVISDFSSSFLLCVVRWIILLGLYLFYTCTIGNLEVFTVVEMSWTWTRNFPRNWHAFKCKSFRASWDATFCFTETSLSATTKEISTDTNSKWNPARILQQQGEHSLRENQWHVTYSSAWAPAWVERDDRSEG